MIETQRKWYIPAPGVLGWHVGFWNFLGGMGFTVCFLFKSFLIILVPIFTHLPPPILTSYSLTSTPFIALRCIRIQYKFRYALSILPLYVLGRVGVLGRECNTMV